MDEIEKLKQELENDYILTSASVKNVEDERRQLTGGVCDPPPAG